MVPPSSSDGHRRHGDHHHQQHNGGAGGEGGPHRTPPGSHDHHRSIAASSSATPPFSASVEGSDGHNNGEQQQQQNDTTPSSTTTTSKDRSLPSMHSPMVTTYMRLPDLDARDADAAAAAAAIAAARRNPPSSLGGHRRTTSGGGRTLRHGKHRHGQRKGRTRAVSLGTEYDRSDYDADAVYSRDSGGSMLLGSAEAGEAREMPGETTRLLTSQTESESGEIGQQQRKESRRPRVTIKSDKDEVSRSKVKDKVGDKDGEEGAEEELRQLTASLSASSSGSSGELLPPPASSSPSDSTTVKASPSASNKEDPFSGESNPISISIIYGLINAAIVLPVLISFGSIIYHDVAFQPYIPVLVKLTVVSGLVHQLCFSSWSSLPFAVGQVQDAGLIFLSKMASDMVRIVRSQGYDDEYMLATVTIGLGLCTALLGMGLFVIGKCRLASYVQLLPTPVVGGYLAYIGFFCGQGGMAIMAGVQVSGLLEWGAFFTPEAIRLVLPGLAGGILIYVMVRRIRHMAVLPCCIVALMVLFYAVLGLTGTTVEEAREDGWISQADPPPVWYRTWDYLRFDKVVWSALPPQSLTLISMIFVVALSSSLDVAAIELELGRPLDYNHELRTVGLSNVVSGLTGGYTGSYIFSQSIFSLRAGIRSRLSGYVLAMCEVVIVVVPVAILSYVPNFFFGSLLTLIAVDLMYEWLWDVRHKVTAAEYAVDVGTFALIHVCGVEYGIILGLVVYLACKKLGADLGGDPTTATGAGTSSNAPRQQSHAVENGEIEKRGGEDAAAALISAGNGDRSPRTTTLATIESDVSLDTFSNYGSNYGSTASTDDVHLSMGPM